MKLASICQALVNFPFNAFSLTFIIALCFYLKGFAGTMPPMTELRPETLTKNRTMVQAIQQGLYMAMEQNENVVVLGEDVGLNGGVFRATEGLQKRFGSKRVMDTPLSESGIVGLAAGLAVYGMRPVAEIQFADYMTPAFDQITQELAKFRYRSGGDYTCPVVLRSPYGGGIKGGLYHSQSPEAYYVHTAGLQVVIPSTAYDAKGLLLSALQSADPVIFLEPKRLYRSKKDEVPDGFYTVPIGPARQVMDGADVTMLAYGAMVEVAQKAAERLLEEDGATVDLLDLRTLNPVDETSILNSVRKTGRVVILHEAPKTGGYGAELAAIIAEKAIDSLQAPIVRVAGYDTPYPYSLEAHYLPHPARVLRALKDVLAYQ
jgi:pyruvate dehydrogenase E1 component beta subunit